ncbi:hypothetical protein NBO_34g0013 [Nosema bombycis CQ1]|uniref:Uncharacterized protein n=1 Tax=Nosema bombycis (strain CQ1 / CVCC 102059) TaxID=578461 RepID=R0MMR1_NOSB1|nr:hypothetical protein NBO_34g0013 [Nosema bombycis CQ1]|eukprot:EOB14163.1 hypothetical protein NBO_34g0013 [Nosema bombycis CQ1]
MTYLKLNYSKKIARKIVEVHLTLENIKSPHYSFIFEDLVEIGDKKTLDSISKFVENNFFELMNDKYGNYVLTKVIKKRPEDTEAFYSKLDLSTLNMNSNIVLRIFENFCKNRDIEKIKKILREFYHIDKDESVFQNLLLKFSDGLNTKYVTVICNLMDLDEDIFNVNNDFVKFYDNAWLNKKCGITLVKGFLEGGAKNKTKRKLLPKITLNKKLLKTKDGLKISNLIKTIKNTRH